MENNNKLQDIDIKNRTCCHSDDVIKVKDIDFDNVFLNWRSYKNILVYKILYKTFIEAKPLPIRFDKGDGVIEIYNEVRYLELFNSRISNGIYDRTNYLIKKRW